MILIAAIFTHQISFLMIAILATPFLVSRLKYGPQSISQPFYVPGGSITTRSTATTAPRWYIFLYFPCFGNTICALCPLCYRFSAIANDSERNQVIHPLAARTSCILKRQEPISGDLNGYGRGFWGGRVFHRHAITVRVCALLSAASLLTNLSMFRIWLQKEDYSI